MHNARGCVPGLQAFVSHLKQFATGHPASLLFFFCSNQFCFCQVLSNVFPRDSGTGIRYQRLCAIRYRTSCIFVVFFSSNQFCFCQVLSNVFPRDAGTGIRYQGLCAPGSGLRDPMLLKAYISSNSLPAILRLCCFFAALNFVVVKSCCNILQTNLFYIIIVYVQTYRVIKNMT
jgi:hypothetical protein